MFGFCGDSLVSSVSSLRFARGLPSSPSSPSTCPRECRHPGARACCAPATSLLLHSGVGPVRRSWGVCTVHKRDFSCPFVESHWRCPEQARAHHISNDCIVRMQTLLTRKIKTSVCSGEDEEGCVSAAEGTAPVLDPEVCFGETELTVPGCKEVVSG